MKKSILLAAFVAATIPLMADSAPRSFGSGRQKNGPEQLRRDGAERN